MLEALLGYKGVWRVLTYFAEAPRKIFDTVELRAATLLGNQPLENALRRLVAAGVLREERGKTRRYFLVLDNPLTQRLLDLAALERETLRHLDYDLRVLLAELLRRLPPGTRAYLFGSHAKGYARSSSDVDVALIEPRLSDAALAAIADELEERHGRRVQLHTFSSDAWKRGDGLAATVRKEGISLTAWRTQSL